MKTDKYPEDLLVTVVCNGVILYATKVTKDNVLDLSKYIHDKLPGKSVLDHSGNLYLLDGFSFLRVYEGDWVVINKLTESACSFTEDLFKSKFEILEDADITGYSTSFYDMDFVSCDSLADLASSGSLIITDDMFDKKIVHVSRKFGEARTISLVAAIDGDYDEKQCVFTYKDTKLTNQKLKDLMGID